MPRLWPAADGCAGANANDRCPPPPTGADPAPAAGARNAAGATARRAVRTPTTTLLSDVRTSGHGRDGTPPLSNEITKLSQRAAVKAIPGHVREARDDVGGDAPGRSSRDQFRHSCKSRLRIGLGRAGA